MKTLGLCTFYALPDFRANNCRVAFDDSIKLDPTMDTAVANSRVQGRASEMSGVEWYLIKTKPGKERWVRDQLANQLPEVFLPMLETRTRRLKKTAMLLVALFPGYLFAQLDRKLQYMQVRYTHGVHGFVCAGYEPIVVSARIVEEIQQRCHNGVVTIPQKPFAKGDRLVITDGPFRGFEAIFQHYFSDADRIALLLGAIYSPGPRVVLPSCAVRHVA